MKIHMAQRIAAEGWGLLGGNLEPFIRRRVLEASLAPPPFAQTGLEPKETPKRNPEFKA